LLRSPEPKRDSKASQFELRQLRISRDDALPNSNSPLFEDLRNRLRLVAGEVPALKGDGVRRIWW